MLVNNAGVAGGGRIDRCTIEEWRQITEVNLFGVVRGVQAFTPMLKAQGSGHLVNVASLAGLVHPAGMGSYNATKAAVVAFTETCGHELAGFGIRASAVCPSYFRTNLMGSMQGSDTALGEIVGARRALRRSPPTTSRRRCSPGMDAGDDVIVPDEPARQAYFLKWADRPAYDAGDARAGRQAGGRRDELTRSPAPGRSATRTPSTWRRSRLAAHARRRRHRASTAPRRSASSPAARPT